MELPAEWVAGLTGGKKRKARPKGKLTSAQAKEWLAERPSGDMCRCVERQVARAVAWFAEHGADGAYDHMRDVVWGLVRDARDGHPGVQSAVAAVERAYLAETENRGRDNEDEWGRSLEGAIKKVAVEDAEPSDEDPCSLYGAWNPVAEDGEGPRRKLGQILSLADLAALPRPEPLIKGVLSLRSAVLMVGSTGTNKTFSALGMACSVATGEPWLGHEVMLTAPVIYVVGEGAYGLPGRINAWQKAHDAKVPADRMTFLLKPDSLVDKGFWAELQAEAKERGARLIILDTFSSLAPDADETKDAAIATRRLSDLSTAIDGTAILVHHTGWGPQDRARGGSQLESNVDEVLVLQKADPEADDSPVSIKRKKVKEGPAGAVIWVQRLPVDDSAVLELADPPRPKTDGPKRGKALSHSDLQTLIAQWTEAHPLKTEKKIVEAVRAENGVGRERVTAAFDALVEQKLIESRRAKVPEDRGEKTVQVMREVWFLGSGRVKRTGGEDRGSG